MDGRFPLDIDLGKRLGRSPAEDLLPPGTLLAGDEEYCSGGEHEQPTGNEDPSANVIPSALDEQYTCCDQEQKLEPFNQAVRFADPAEKNEVATHDRQARCDEFVASVLPSAGTVSS